MEQDINDNTGTSATSGHSTHYTSVVCVYMCDHCFVSRMMKWMEQQQIIRKLSLLAPDLDLTFLCMSVVV